MRPKLICKSPVTESPVRRRVKAHLGLLASSCIPSEHEEQELRERRSNGTGSFGLGVPPVIGKGQIDKLCAIVGYKKLSSIQGFYLLMAHFENRVHGFTIVLAQLLGALDDLNVAFLNVCVLLSLGLRETSLC